MNAIINKRYLLTEENQRIKPPSGYPQNEQERVAMTDQILNNFKKTIQKENLALNKFGIALRLHSAGSLKGRQTTNPNEPYKTDYHTIRLPIIIHKITQDETNDDGVLASAIAFTLTLMINYNNDQTLKESEQSFDDILSDLKDVGDPQPNNQPDEMLIRGHKLEIAMVIPIYTNVAIYIAALCFKRLPFPIRQGYFGPHRHTELSLNYRVQPSPIEQKAKENWFASKEERKKQGIDKKIKLLSTPAREGDTILDIFNMSRINNIKTLIQYLRILGISGDTDGIQNTNDDNMDGKEKVEQFEVETTKQKIKLVVYITTYDRYHLYKVGFNERDSRGRLDQRFFMAIIRILPKIGTKDTHISFVPYIKEEIVKSFQPFARLVANKLKEEYLNMEDKEFHSKIETQQLFSHIVNEHPLLDVSDEVVERNAKILNSDQAS